MADIRHAYLSKKLQMRPGLALCRTLMTPLSGHTAIMYYEMQWRMGYELYQRAVDLQRERKIDDCDYLVCYSRIHLKSVLH